MSKQPTVLAFDTSGEQLAIALVHGGGMLLDNGPGGAAASASLLPRIHALLAQAGMGLQRLDAVAYGEGPGAFTGLRTSCAVAQGLGFGLGCPLLAIDSLLIVAEDARVQAAGQPGPGATERAFEVAVAMDARMEETYVGHYRYVYGGAEQAGDLQLAVSAWHPLRQPALLSLPALCNLWGPGQTPAWRAGSAWAVFGERVHSQPGPHQFDIEQNRAAALGRLAQQAWQFGDKLDPAGALPNYLRDKVALTTLERQAVKANAAR